MSFQGRDLISMNDLTREEIDQILLKVKIVRDHPQKKDLCKNKVSAMPFCTIDLHADLFRSCDAQLGR